jgi:hypothetical protein
MEKLIDKGVFKKCSKRLIIIQECMNGNEEI